MNRTFWVVVACAALLGCKDEDARSAWNDVVKRCAVTDLTGPNVLYFGPSNGVGPGSVWRRPAEGGYRLRYSLVDMRGTKPFIEPGVKSACDGTSTSRFGAKASIGLTSSVAPVSAELANDFKRARSIHAKAQAVTWDLVREGPYEDYIKALPAVDVVRVDLGKGDRLVLYRALKVSGFSATLEFNDSDVAGLKGKYSGTLPKALTGDVGVELSASWSADNKLTLSSTDDFYIAGELVPFKAGEFAVAGTKRFGAPITISPPRDAARDETD